MTNFSENIPIIVDMTPSFLMGECIKCHLQGEAKILVFPKQEPQMDGQFLKSGEKKDEGKARFELLAYEVIQAIAQILTEGAKKYESRNWEKGIAYGRVFGGVQRHLCAWWNSKIEKTDGINHADGNASHLDHAITGLMFLSAYEKRGMKDFDDRPTGKV